MTFDEASTNMKWEMNIVESKQPVSRFFYSRFLVTALPADQTLPPQPAPTPMPVVGPQDNPIPIGSGATTTIMVTSFLAIVTTATWALW